MKKRIGVASAVVAAAAAFTSALLARRARFFAQAPPQRNETFTTSAGPVVELPVRYSDGSLMGAFWLVEETKAAALLPDNLEPLPLPEETPRSSYELDPALIQLVGVLCLVGGCLGLVVYAILSIDE